MSLQLGIAVARLPSVAPGTITVSIGLDGVHAGEIVLSDKLRGGTGALLRNVRSLGITRVVLATGDRADVAHAVLRGLDIDDVRADLSPDQKVLVVLSEREERSGDDGGRRRQ